MSSDPKASEILFRLKIFILPTLIVWTGCNFHAASFDPNRLLTARMESELQVNLTSIQNQVQMALQDLFGTPDQPHWPQAVVSDPRCATLVDPVGLDRAAGPVRRDEQLVERGLYRKHCAQCHGITGDGLGPAAALLNPYPRDFRRGSFKFKSTVQTAKPTLGNLVRTIEHGIPGTSMPAMANLIRGSHYDHDIPILAGYVRFLAIRGEVERRLMMELVRDLDLDAGEKLYDLQLQETDPAQFAKQSSKIDEVVLKVASSWTEPVASEVASIDGLRFDSNESMEKAESEAFVDSATRGRQLFQSEVAACSQCHGGNGDGHGKLVDFDEWTKDWTIRAGIDPKDSTQWSPLKKLGLLKPVPSVARNLQLGVFRGGRAPDAIYRTIVDGIDGTPMPAAARQPSVKNGLTEEQVWDLVNYCQALGIADFRQRLEASHGKR